MFGAVFTLLGRLRVPLRRPINCYSVDWLFAFGEFSTHLHHKSAALVLENLQIYYVVLSPIIRHSNNKILAVDIVKWLPSNDYEWQMCISSKTQG